jgi:hypothetical protein
MVLNFVFVRDEVKDKKKIGLGHPKKYSRFCQKHTVFLAKKNKFWRKNGKNKTIKIALVDKCANLY